MLYQKKVIYISKCFQSCVYLYQFKRYATVYKEVGKRSFLTILKIKLRQKLFCKCILSYFHVFVLIENMVRIKIVPATNI